LRQQRTGRDFGLRHGQPVYRGVAAAPAPPVLNNPEQPNIYRSVQPTAYVRRGHADVGAECFGAGPCKSGALIHPLGGEPDRDVSERMGDHACGDALVHAPQPSEFIDRAHDRAPQLDGEGEIAPIWFPARHGSSPNAFAIAAS
jgi:hypothetical protein